MKVLLIDDSTLSRNILKKAMGDQYTVLEAENGMRGLELYYLEHPDLVILDLTMPGMSGFEILEKLRQIDPNARIIIGSADIQDFSRTKAEQLGASAFLTKPFLPERVHEVLKKVIETSDR